MRKRATSPVNPWPWSLNSSTKSAGNLVAALEHQTAGWTAVPWEFPARNIKSILDFACSILQACCILSTTTKAGPENSNSKDLGVHPLALLLAGKAMTNICSWPRLPQDCPCPSPLVASSTGSSPHPARQGDLSTRLLLPRAGRVDQCLHAPLYSEFFRPNDAGDLFMMQELGVHLRAPPGRYLANQQPTTRHKLDVSRESFNI